MVYNKSYIDKFADREGGPLEAGVEGCPGELGEYFWWRTEKRTLLLILFSSKRFNFIYKEHILLP